MSDSDDAGATGDPAGRGALAQGLSRANHFTKKTLEWYPIRVWRHFLKHNGFLLAAGISYQALFAIFASIYVAFAGIGLWLGSNSAAIDWLITVIRGYVPGLISGNGADGVISPDQLHQVASSSGGLLSVTGLVAIATLIWTAIGWVTYSRRAVRDIFGVPPDERNALWLKVQDLIAALVFGITLIVGGLLGVTGRSLAHQLFTMLGLSTSSWLFDISLQLITLVVSGLINLLALAGMFRFLAGTTLPWRQILPGSALGALALSILQAGLGLLLGYTPSNPLLTTFAVFIGLLLWFRIVGIVVLVAAAWIAVSAEDANVPILQPTEDERRAAEHAALLTAAQVRVREARERLARAPWYRRLAARRELTHAEDHLVEVASHTPPHPPSRYVLSEVIRHD